MNITDFLSRLEKVKKRGAGQWLACCPAHGDRNPSLSIGEAADGRILLNCLSQGCSAGDVAAAVGLTLSDLFPEKLSLHHVPPMKRYIPAHDVLETIVSELEIICVIASDMHKGRTVTQKDYDRLYLAHQRIAMAKEKANG